MNGWGGRYNSGFFNIKETRGYGGRRASSGSRKSLDIVFKIESKKTTNS